jgi:hypothetical protein
MKKQNINQKHHINTDKTIRCPKCDKQCQHTETKTYVKYTCTPCDEGIIIWK